MHRTLAAFALVFLVALAPTPARAQGDADKTTARNLFLEARAALDAGDHARAAELFERSNQVFPAPTARLGLARALLAMGKLVRAYETLQAIVNEGVPADASDPFKEAVRVAESERATLAKRLPALILGVTPADGVVSVDGEVVPAAALGARRPVDPGEHLVSASAPGRLALRRTVTVVEGATVEVTLALEPEPASSSEVAEEPAPAAPLPPPTSPPPDEDRAGGWMRPTGLVVGGVGIAGLVAGAVTGGLYLKAKSDAGDDCREAADGAFDCTQAGLDAVDRARALATANTVAIVAGGVLAGAGLTLVLVAPGDAEPEIAVLAGPGAAGFRIGGSF
jgi:tetratricopeptide repeat protein